MKSFLFLLSLVLAACGPYETAALTGEVVTCNTNDDCAGNANGRTVCGLDGRHGSTTTCVTDITNRCNHNGGPGTGNFGTCGGVCRNADPANLCPANQPCGIDADCNYTVDPTLRCVSGVCLSQSSNPYTCSATNMNGTCPSGSYCNSTGTCVQQSQYTCSTTNTSGTCPSGYSCSTSGTCVQQNGSCSTSNPTGTCVAGFTCVSGACVQQACSLTYPNGYCPSGQACNGGRCVASSASTLCGTSTTATNATCYGQPDLNNVTPQSGPYQMSPGVQFCCPSGFDSSFTVPRGTVGTCYGSHSNAGSAFGQLTVASSYGCQI